MTTAAGGQGQGHWTAGLHSWPAGLRTRVGRGCQVHKAAGAPASSRGTEASRTAPGDPASPPWDPPHPSTSLLGNGVNSVLRVKLSGSTPALTWPPGTWPLI